MSSKKKDRTNYVNIPIIENASKILMKLMRKRKRNGRAAEIEKLLYESVIIKLHYKISSLIFLILFLSISCSWYYDSFLSCVSHFNALESITEQYILNICLSYSFTEDKEHETKKNFLLFYKWIPFALIISAALNFISLRGVKRKLLFIEDDDSFLAFINHFYSPLTNVPPSSKEKISNQQLLATDDVKSRVAVVSFPSSFEKNGKGGRKEENFSDSVGREENMKEKTITRGGGGGAAAEAAGGGGGGEEKKGELFGRKQKMGGEEESGAPREMFFSSPSTDDEEEEYLYADEDNYCKTCVQTFLINWNGYSQIFYNYFFSIIFCLCLDVFIFFFINFCLQGKFWNYGFATFPYAKRVINFDDPMSKTFPPFVKCVMFQNSFLIMSGRVEEYGCHFTLMELYEKLFLFLWFWLIFLFSITFIYLSFILTTVWIIPPIRNWILAGKFKRKRGKKITIIGERDYYSSTLDQFLKLTSIGESVVLNCMLELFSKRNAHFERFCNLLINQKTITILKTIRNPVDKMLYFEKFKFNNKNSPTVFKDV